MGFNLTIGEFKYEVGYEDRHVFADVVKHELEYAPMNSSNDRTSCCYPSYRSWSEFLKLVNLEDVFYAGRNGFAIGLNNVSSYWIDSKGNKRSGLIEKHPGVKALDEEHLKEFKKAKERYLKAPIEEQVIDKETGIDYNIRRLNWLVFWTEWALNNCDYPTFGNS